MGARSGVPSLRFVVSLVGEIIVRDAAGARLAEREDEVIEQHLDRVMDELENLGAVDPSIELCGIEVEVSLLVEAGNPVGAISQASGLLRTAIHAAHGGTPDWPVAEDDSAWAVQLVGVRSHSAPMETTETESAHQTKELISA